MTIDGTVRTQDTNTVFSYLNRFNLGHVLAWDFLRAEWSNLKLGRR